MLTNQRIREIQALAIRAGLHNRRAALMNGLDPAYVAALSTDPTPAAQLLLDLTEMNRHGTIAEGMTPLLEWLLTASALVAAVPAQQKAFDEFARDVARYSTRSAEPAVRPDGEVQERIIGRSNLLPADFLAGALRTARAVMRLVVPRIEGGAQQLRASSGEPVVSYGSGWLIGRNHVMTNCHVVEARAAGEARPDPADFRAQAEGIVAEFDFDTQSTGPGFTRCVVALERFDAALDYAVLRLASAAEGETREPLLLRSSGFTLSREDPFPVNIVQHPRGAAKQFAIRDNLAATLTDQELTYFTDTEGGSSGAPVCDDAWRVVALHRGSRFVAHSVNFQGKDTAWINAGTPILPIIAHLREDAALWQAIAARLAP
jgi:endonuclease G